MRGWRREAGDELVVIGIGGWIAVQVWKLRHRS
jgi:hypothetical protein